MSEEKKQERREWALKNPAGFANPEFRKTEKYKLSRKIVDRKNTKKFDELLDSGSRRRHIIREQNNKCNSCKLSEWMNKPIVLELEHIDGDNQNNTRDNLEALCPNCHSLTITWRGRNKANTGKQKISNDKLIEALNTSDNIRQALLKVGLAAKGGNYKRAKKLLNK